MDPPVCIVVKKTWISILLISTLIYPSLEINLGLLGGDLSKRYNPLSVRKYSHNAPVVINIRGLPTVPPKPPPLLKSVLVKGLLPPKVPRLPKLPLLPLLPPPLPFFPHVPILPPLLPRLLPPLLPPLVFPPPILPVPRLPRLPPLLSPLQTPLLAKPTKPSLLRLTPLGKKGILGNSLDLTKAPIVPKLERTASKRCTIQKLLELRRNGSITMAEYFRFKKLLT